MNDNGDVSSQVLTSPARGAGRLSLLRVWRDEIGQASENGLCDQVEERTAVAAFEALRP